MSNLSEARVMEVLGQLRGESDSMVILEVLKKAEQMEGACIDKDRRSELEIQNPKAYPMLPQDSLDEPGQVEFEQLAQSNEDKTPPPFRASQGEPSSHPGGESLCDRRLEKLDMKHWTSVSVGNDIAAQAISLYLEIDHPLLGFFEPDLFLSSLTNPDTAHCSSILVNALLYWATVSIQRTMVCKIDNELRSH